jgi:hypothetical protein
MIAIRIELEPLISRKERGATGAPLFSGYSLLRMSSYSVFV